MDIYERFSIRSVIRHNFTLVSDVEGHGTTEQVCKAGDLEWKTDIRRRRLNE